MRGLILAFSALALVAVASAGTTAPAEAKAAAKKHYRPLVVQKRSFLDLGKAVPLGYGANYANDSSFAGRPAFGHSFSSDRFGGGNLPTRFFAPGRPQPVAQFYTPVF